MAVAARKSLIWILPVYILMASSQHLDIDVSKLPKDGICPSMYCANNAATLKKLKDCVVILGNLRVVLMEGTKPRDFQGLSFPNLREVTGFMVVYRVKGLDYLGKLFPNLTRIRGNQLFNNYALIIHDMFNFKGINLHSLLRIDRGGVFIWGDQSTCYVNTVKNVNWTAIAPETLHTITFPEFSSNCHPVKACKCGSDDAYNYCWNSTMCQRFLTGPRGEKCNPQCLGCQGSSDLCSVCRLYTYKGHCVNKCPTETIILQESQYCVTVEECSILNGWTWNNSCVFECPVDYTRSELNGTITCELCFECQKVCPSLNIDSLSTIQQASRCVHVKGNLTIHLRFVPKAMEELMEHLRFIEIVDDFVCIYGSLTIKSLKFLPNLRHIGGMVLMNNTYSLVIHDMMALEETFTHRVLDELIVEDGRLKVLNNPNLCVSKVNQLKKKFPEESNSTDIPFALNGYSGGCDDDIGLKVEVLNETAASVTFSPAKDSDLRYSVLYAKVAPESQTTIVPETCESEWFTIHADQGKVTITSLLPASTYAVCIEVYTFYDKDLQDYLARTTVVNFDTPFKKPQPPFIKKIIATSPNVIELRWTDHRDYRKHITHYELDAILIEIPSKDLLARDHCNGDIVYETREINNPHAIVEKPPVDYNICGDNCINLNAAPGTVIEDNFDICSSLGVDCDIYEDVRPKNTTYKSYIKSMTVDIRGQTSFKVKGLAPYRDYKFRLRSCSNKKCSRSTRHTIRTLRSDKADVPAITHVALNETGYIFVKWKPPDITNGPLFVYMVQILQTNDTYNSEVLDEMSSANFTNYFQNTAIPDTICVYPEHVHVVAKIQPTNPYHFNQYRFRVCSSTLGSISACSRWENISVPEDINFFVAALSFSVILLGITIVIGFYHKKRNVNNDMVSLVDMTSMHRSESEPPSVMMSDFMPIYSIAELNMPD